VELEELGDLICILGPSNSRKSTLAAAMLRVAMIPGIAQAKLESHSAALHDDTSAAVELGERDRDQALLRAAGPLVSAMR
jgi:ABC-type protease/lipase transport system fused ATPase/permease subunit